MPAHHSITLSDVVVTFGDGPPVLEDVTCTLPTGRVGVVGRNGAGKSSLLRLITSELSPTSGSIDVPGEVGTVPQDLLQRPDETVAEILGVDAICRAIRAIAGGSTEGADYDAVGSDWDIEARATALVARRVPSLAVANALDRRAATLSGGELMLVALARLELSRAAISVMDEPTNNLDAGARKRLYDAVEGWNGTLLIVSHDVELLRRMETIVEVHGGQLRVFGGNYDLYLEQVAGEQEAAHHTVRSAEDKLRAEKRDRDHMQKAMASRARQNRSTFTRVAGGPRLSDPTAKRSAEARRAGEVKGAAQRVQAAKGQVAEAESALRDDDHIRVDIIDPHTAAGRRLAELVGTNQGIQITGGKRWGLVGDNGVGKTSLLRSMLQPGEPSRSPAHGELFTSRVGYLDQNLMLDDDATILDNVRQSAPTRLPHDIRAQLARFLVRGDMVERFVGDLSGGERFRVALARILLAHPVPELLILDEPTNNLDLASIDQLVDGVQAYRGALLVVSHDVDLLERLVLDEVVRLGADGSLHVT
ncbi:ABC-F family ATP-binding cassette domain-containing protein [Tessaracoccus antarcticus]|uniref:ABC transporter ATP-binding protein n=1 Tax=Tessaracoccus antarcticus TaxID=2479848 RepID=A0A3M0G3I1_9ACTN|nr:ABC-F family ATP-binding cassette domain-containing protein [Tessaracoccus antarcticus]RMB58717.1 ABC transporter ATP-binding protein [Tessaracoccus antarcticus]